MKVAVIVFPGSNCDRDCLDVVRDVVGASVQPVWHRETVLPSVDLVILPGGFSYGDYLRTGALAASSPVMTAVKAHAVRGGLVLGICNGFQILIESGLLPGALLRNASLRFICRMVGVRVERTDTPFTTRYAAGQVLALPIAHADGAYWADPQTLRQLREEGRVVFRYAALPGSPGAEANPNGSVDGIAGICNQTRNILGLMPHPERASETRLGGVDGLALFQSAVDSLCGA
ncbi:MAG: phosphoribosylformylglycinamidine synthase subunit PurQ [Nitrospirae bacterium]|nr:phosphoribosylformylglycinamidine synthase subunit PurQ [Nitrospirota bacterium]